MIDGMEYEMNTVPNFRCRNCTRVTLTGLCGCPNCDPVNVGTIAYATPVDGLVYSANGRKENMEV